MTTAVPLPLAAVVNLPLVVATAPEGPVPAITFTVVGGVVTTPPCKYIHKPLVPIILVMVKPQQQDTPRLPAVATKAETHDQHALFGSLTS